MQHFKQCSNKMCKSKKWMWHSIVDCYKMSQTINNTVVKCHIQVTKCDLFNSVPTSFHGFGQNVRPAPHGLRVVQKRLRMASRRPSTYLRASQEFRTLFDYAIYPGRAPRNVPILKLGVQCPLFRQPLHVRTDRVRFSSSCPIQDHPSHYAPRRGRKTFWANSEVILHPIPNRKSFPTLTTSTSADCWWRHRGMV
jgi:hypothetical protein